MTYKQPHQQYPNDYDPSLNGLSGWLKLLIWGRYLGIAWTIKNILFFISKMSLYTKSTTYIIIASFAIFGILLPAVTLFYMLKRNIVFRKIYVYEAAIGIVVYVALTIYLSNKGISLDILWLIKAILPYAIWIPYLYKSKRVKNTYIYKY